MPAAAVLVLPFLFLPYPPPSPPSCSAVRAEHNRSVRFRDQHGALLINAARRRLIWTCIVFRPPFKPLARNILLPGVLDIDFFPLPQHIIPKNATTNSSDRAETRIFQAGHIGAQHDRNVLCSGLSHSSNWEQYVPLPICSSPAASATDTAKISAGFPLPVFRLTALASLDFKICATLLFDNQARCAFGSALAFKIPCRSSYDAANSTRS
ncbi:hypothetical protein DFH09DRAFT_1368258 [Mycena vulgaris]|nr:hypothetical protein DFH09DRAFT_1368258 [Mycena vulgaris]